MFLKRKIQEAKVTVGDARTVTGNRIVLQPVGAPRSGFNTSLSMNIPKMYFIMEDDTILELHVKESQQETIRKGTRGTVRYKKGKLIEFIPE